MIPQAEDRISDQENKRFDDQKVGKITLEAGEPQELCIQRKMPEEITTFSYLSALRAALASISLRLNVSLVRLSGSRQDSKVNGRLT